MTPRWLTPAGLHTASSALPVESRLVNGTLHHIGIGRSHARTPVILLIQDLHVRVVAAATGELLRELTIDPRRDYQPRGLPPGPPPGTRNSRTHDL